MPRVKIKTNNSKDSRKTGALLEILSKNDVYINKLISLADGYVVIVTTEEEQDKIFKNKTTQELAEKDFQPIIPPELKTNRSIIITNVDNHICNNNEEDIISEIYEKNHWAENNIESLFKFPNFKTIKITFNETSIPKKPQTNGLRLFSMSLPAHSIRQEIFYKIATCFRC